MGNRWVVASGGGTSGPFDYVRLGGMAEGGELSPLDMVRDGESGVWVSARDVPGLKFATAATRPPERTEPDREVLREVARRQRHLNLAAAAGVVLVAASDYAPPGWAANAPGGAVAWSALAASAAWLWLAVRLGRSLGLGTLPVALSMAVPFLNALTILWLSARATALLRSEGVRVGFLGASGPVEPPDVPVARAAAPPRRRRVVRWLFLAGVAFGFAANYAAEGRGRVAPATKVFGALASLSVLAGCAIAFVRGVWRVYRGR